MIWGWGMGWRCDDCGSRVPCDASCDCYWETAWTTEDALDALKRFRILDEDEDDLPPCLVDYLREAETVRAHIRYEGGRAIWWFDSWATKHGYEMPAWPKDLLYAAAVSRAMSDTPGDQRAAA